MGDGLVVRAGSVHSGAARRLVHVLKYRGVPAAAAILAEPMTAFVDDDAVLVPVPRVVWRAVRYGIDPALELAVAVGLLTGRPVARLLRAPFWGRARAGGVHGAAPRFRETGGHGLDAPLLLVDDVVTSGATMTSAARRLPGVVGAIAATSAPTPVRIAAHTVTSLRREV